MTKKLVTLAVVGLILTAAHLTAVPRPNPAPGDMMKHTRFGIYMAEKNLFPAHILLRFKDEIGLTEDQVNKIEKMQELFMESTIRGKADLKIKEVKLHSYLKENQVDRKKMEKMIREIASMKTDMQIAHINYLLDLKDVLTPEQLQKIETFKKERWHQRMKERKPRMKERMKRFKEVEEK
jgi:Spy/CpxP family protein refolding chaperone